MASSRSRFLKKFLILFGAGMAGVLSLVPSVGPTLAQKLAELPDAPALPPAVLVPLMLIQPSVLLAVSVAIGLLIAPQLNLRSHLAALPEDGAPGESAQFRREMPVAILLGALSWALTAAFDWMVFRPLMPEIWQKLTASLTHQNIWYVLAGVLYGGITEELLLRWGLLSLLAWAGWRLFNRRSQRETPSPAIMWTAIILSALAFGAGHLVSTAILVPITPVVVMRALLLNGIIGIACGWLFWRRSLEAAMLAHASWHLTATVAALIIR
jgi:membrane protease YdiL (CAAX protease family)